MTADAPAGPASGGTAGAGRTIVRVLIVLAALVFAPWVLLGLHLDAFGEPAVAVVTGKREAIALRQDHWHRDLQVSYRYPVRESGQALDVTQPVDAQLYAGLAVADRVPVRYSPWSLLRSFGSAGCTLAAASWATRLPRWSDQVQFLVEVGLFAAAAWLVYLAYRRRSWPLGLVATTAVATVAAGVLLFGYPVVKLIGGASRRFKDLAQRDQSM